MEIFSNCYDSMKSHLFQLLTHHLVSHLVSSSSEMFCHWVPSWQLSANTGAVHARQPCASSPLPHHSQDKDSFPFSSELPWYCGQMATLCLLPTTDITWSHSSHPAPPQHRGDAVSRQAQISVTCSTSQLVEQDPALHWQPPNLPRDSPSRLLLFRS